MSGAPTPSLILAECSVLHTIDSKLGGIVSPMVHSMAKFHMGQPVHNRNTKEDGFVSHVFADEGIITYEVWVPKDSNSWEAGHWISHWLESVVQPSSNRHLGSPLTN